MSSRARQLQGLNPPDRAGTIPPPASKRQNVEPAAPSLAADANGSTGKQQPRRRSGAHAATTPTPPPNQGKHRRAVTVPTTLVEQLRHRARELDRYHTDLILDCLAANATTLEGEHDTDRTPADSPYHRPRRLAHRGRTTTTLTLYLTRAEVDAMDALATRLGLSRSAVVAAALDRGLDQLT